MDSSKNNQRAIFERLVRPHLERLYRLSYRLTHNKAEADDLFQDVLTRIYARLDDLLAVRDPGPWLCRVMYNHFIDDTRRFARQRLVTVDAGQLPEQSVENFPGDGNPVRDAEQQDNIKQLRNALAELSDEHRTVILLHDVEGYKLSEIQSLTGSPVGTVKSRLHRARGRLRELLQERGTFSGD